MKKHVFHNIDTYELGVCARQYLFVKHLKKFDGQGTEFSEGVVSFVTDDSYFASLGHGKDYACLEKGAIDLYAQHGDIDDPEVIGWALRASSTGIHGKFADGYTPPLECKMKVLPIKDICLDSAEVWMPFLASDPIRYTGKIVELPKESVMDSIIFEVDEPNIIGIHKGIEGSVIVQDGKIAAVVRSMNGKHLECVSAELVAADLFRTMYEQSFIGEI